MVNIIKIADFSDEALDFYAREKEAQLKHRPHMAGGCLLRRVRLSLREHWQLGMSRYHFSWKKRTSKSRGGNLSQNTRRFQFLQHRLMC